MPTLKLNWAAAGYVPGDEVYGANPWITYVRWRRTDTNQLLPVGPGLYVIVNAAGRPVYAGKAANLRQRFIGRSAALHELSVHALPLGGIGVWVATVTGVPAAARVASGEQWLIRALARRDALPPGPRIVQNVVGTGSYAAPAGGLTITFTDATAPAFVKDSPNYTVSMAGVGKYSYPVGTTVLP